MFFISEYSKNLPLNEIENKIPCVHTLKKCAAYTYATLLNVAIHKMIQRDVIENLCNVLT
jgi:hypothetical protein